MSVAPNSFAARVMLAVLATAGFFYVNIMAALVSGLMDALGFTATDAGLVASCNVYGAAAGALFIVFFVTRVPWRRTSALLLLALMALDALSIFVREAPSLMALRFCHGLVGGALVGLTYSRVARMEAPDRTFGVLLIVQFGLGGLAIALLPPLVPTFGTAALFCVLIAFSLVALGMLRFLDDYPARDVVAAARGTRAGYALVFTFLTIFVFQAANMGLAAYVIEIGRSAGLETAATSWALGVATWLGLLGGAIVVAMPARFGRVWPLMAGIVLTAAGSWALRFSESLVVYFAANAVVAVTWALCIAYLLGMCAQLSVDGRVAALGGFVSKMGLASGPAVCAFALQRVGYPVLIDVSAALILSSGVLCLAPAIALDRPAGRAL
jgi:predicted MFS family arabinose efflux permease